MTKKTEPRITNVYTFPNGMCMVFDQYGKQMPDYQGPTEECMPKIRATGYADPASERIWRGTAADGECVQKTEG